jgi:ankyrin repeat protein
MLLAAGADPNIVTNPKDSQWTALDWALQAKQPAIAKLLREHGAVESGRRRGG